MVDGPRRFIISMQTCNPSKIESRLYLKTAKVDRNRWRVGTTRKGSWRRFVGRDLAGRGCYGNERCNLGDRTEGAFLKELGWVAIILVKTAPFWNLSKTDQICFVLFMYQKNWILLIRTIACWAIGSKLDLGTRVPCNYHVWIFNSGPPVRGNYHKKSNFLLVPAAKLRARLDPSCVNFFPLMIQSESWHPQHCNSNEWKHQIVELDCWRPRPLHLVIFIIDEFHETPRSVLIFTRAVILCH